MSALLLLSFLLLSVAFVSSQTDTLGLADGYLSLSTANFNLKLVKDAQVLASLQNKNGSFDFSPYDVLSQRAANGNHHLGDLTLRYRLEGQTAWTWLDSSAARKHVTAVNVTGALAASDMTPTLNGTNLPLSVERVWSNLGGDLALTFTITNHANTSLELGSLGFPIEFNSIFTSRTSVQTNAVCSLQDPYIGLGAGYVQVTPLNASNPALVVTGLNGTEFQAWRFLPENTGTALGYQSQTFEGFYEWMPYSAAWAQNEWKNVTPWNVATSKIIDAGESATLGLRFSLAAGGVRNIDATVQKAGKPTALSIPGYIIPSDGTAELYLTSPSALVSSAVDPAGAFTVTKSTSGNTTHLTLTPSSSTFGRIRLTLTYADSTTQTLHYWLLGKAAPQTLAALGNFLTTKQYFNYTNDPFHRGPSVITYNRAINDIVYQDPRVWIAGLSDEGGAGSWLAAAVKTALQPVPREVAALEAFASQTLWGTIQVGNSSGTANYGVRKSVFYYEPSLVPGYTYNASFNWGSWESWDQPTAYDTSRAYDYVHVSVAYWALYRVARAYPTLVSRHDWAWYLNQAYQTVMYVTQPGSAGGGGFQIPYADDGLMGETAWGSILTDLYRENMTTQAQAFEARMRARANYWATEAVPFGSEMAWDSTGQEGVWYWGDYFNMTGMAQKSLLSVLGYTPTIGHWGWNGNARRYWDNLYAGSLQYARIERQIHHYGSAMNSLVLLGHVRKTPSDGYSLRAGYGGIWGPMSSIDAGGFAAASFHSWPQTLVWDPYSGDYGVGFLGAGLGIGCYVVDGATVGVDQDLVAFGGSVSGSTVQLTDPVRKRVYLGPYGTLVEIDAGAIGSVTINSAAQTASFQLLAAVPGVTGAASAASAIVWVSTVEAGRSDRFGVTTTGLQASRGGSKVVFSGSAPVTVQIGKVS